ncbi:hypothetical protein ABIE33_007299, partial [Ensifer sp. 4252]
FAESARLHQNLLDHKARENSTFEVRYSAGGLPVNAGGKRVKGLVNRRSAEAGLWAKGEFVSSNTVPAAPKAPEVVTKENVSWVAGIVSTLGFAFTGNGPLQWALAGIIVVSFAGGAYLFIRNRLDPA